MKSVPHDVCSHQVAATCDNGHESILATLDGTGALARVLRDINHICAGPLLPKHRFDSLTLHRKQSLQTRT